MNLLSSIGFLAIFGLVAFLLIYWEQNKEKEAKQLLKLISETHLERDFERFRLSHKGLSLEQAARKFFAEQGRLEKALKDKEERDRLNNAFEEEKKKEFTIKRVYAYKYEDFLFSLYSPLSDYSPGVNTWSSPTKGLTKKYILYRMEKAGYENVEDLFREFLENDLLTSFYHKADDYRLGTTLFCYPNIISEEDYNIDKWIKKHGQTMSKEELLRDVDTYDFPF